MELNEQMDLESNSKTVIVNDASQIASIAFVKFN